MNEKLFQGQSLIYDNQQDNNRQDNVQNQNDQLVFKLDRSLNLPQSIQIAQISIDEKYLTTPIGWRKIQIYYLKNKKLIRNHKFDSQYFNILKFSNNSRYLLFGDNYGFLGCFDLNNDYKLIMGYIHDEQILTSSKQNSIILTNITSQYQLLRIVNGRNDLITGIEFDKSNDFIISCSSDCSIKFFNRNDGKLQINQQNAHQRIDDEITMIQLIEKDNHLISITFQQLILWLIDYQSFQLIKLKEFNNIIFNFTSVFNNNKIVVICDECIQILDKDLVLIQSINHLRNRNLGIFILQYNYIDIICILAITKTRQIDSLNYILIKYGLLLILKKFGKFQK